MRRLINITKTFSLAISFALEFINLMLLFHRYPRLSSVLLCLSSLPIRMYQTTSHKSLPCMQYTKEFCLQEIEGPINNKCGIFLNLQVLPKKCNFMHTELHAFQIMIYHG